jgi:NIMA-interacting peptidyl-prolyl cis-trans isomerase 1
MHPVRYREARQKRGKSSWRVALVGIAIAAVTASCEDKSKTSAAGDVPTATASVVASAPTVPADTPSASASAMPSATASAPVTVPDTIAAQHVLVAYKGAEKAPKGVTRTKAEAKKRAEEVAAKAKSGADFSALVAEYSDDPAAKERQGSLGKFKRETKAKPFSDAAFALAVGESSGAVETPFGFHVIKRNQ